MTEHQHGRVAEDGTVFVRRADGEEVAVGQWAAGDPAAGLAFFERKYDGLRAEGELLLARLRDGKGTPDSVATVTAKLRDAVENPHVVGDLSALASLADSLEAAGEVRREQAAAAREAARAQTIALRTAIAEEAEQLSGSTQWKATGERFKELQSQWTALPRGDKSTRDAEQELWKRFSGARSAFDRARRAHFATLDATRKEAMAAKEALIARAEELSGSTDWAETARAYRGLMEQWKAAPRAGRADRDRVEGRLRRVEDAVRRFEEDQWRRTDPAKRALAESTVGTFRDSLAKLEAEAQAAQSAGNERKAADLQGRISQTRALLEAAENSLAEYSG